MARENRSDRASRHATELGKDSEITGRGTGPSLLDMFNQRNTTNAQGKEEHGMQNEIGIAGWLYSAEILREKTLTQLELPAIFAAHGVKTVELCSAFFESQHTNYLNDLRGLLEDNGLSVRSMAVDMGNIAGADAAKRRTDIEGLKQWFYTAAAIGSEAIRINTGSADDDGAIDRVIEGYRELAAVGADAGVKLLMENHGGISSYAADVQRVLDGVASDNFGTCPDTANFAPEHWDGGMRALAPQAFSVHVKVHSYDEDGTQRRINQRTGEEVSYNLRTGLEILRDANYEGPICIEGAVPAADGGLQSTGFAETRDYVQNMMASL